MPSPDTPGSTPVHPVKRELTLLLRAIAASVLLLALIFGVQLWLAERDARRIDALHGRAVDLATSMQVSYSEAHVAPGRKNKLDLGDYDPPTFIASVTLHYNRILGLGSELLDLYAAYREPELDAMRQRMARAVEELAALRGASDAEAQLNFALRFAGEDHYIYIAAMQARRLHEARYAQLSAELARRNRWVAAAMATVALALLLGLALLGRRTLRQIDDILGQQQGSEERLVQAQAIAQVGSWDLDLVSGELYWSREIYRLFEIDLEKFGATYEAFLNAIHPEDRDAVNQAYTNSLANRAPYQIDHRLLMADGRVKYVQERCDSSFDAEGKPMRSRGTVQDITERVLAERKIASALREKEILLKEVYHRVKNNLQVVSSMLNMQSYGAGEEARALLKESANRVKSMALVHEQLYRATDLASIDLHQYLRQLGQHLEISNKQVAHRVQLKLEVDDISMGIESAVPLGLLINELISNAYKHAFPGQAGGQISLGLHALGNGELELSVTDDGVGLPADFDPSRTRSLGMQLVISLAEQLEGRLQHGPNGPTGSRFALRFKPEEQADEQRLAPSRSQGLQP